MSYPVNIDLLGLPVLVIGGGHVAFRKAAQCIKQGALICVYANHLSDEFSTLATYKRISTYHAHMLSKYVLCIVCSDDKAFNQRVFTDAIEHHCLCMGAHLDDDANTRPLMMCEHGDLQVAVSTKGAFPALSSKLAKKALSYLVDEEYEKLVVLSKLRQRLKEILPEQARRNLCQSLVHADMTLISSIYTQLQKKEQIVLCYHGVKEEAVLQDVRALQECFALQYPHAGIGSVYICDEVCQVLNATKRHIFSLDEWMSYITQCKDMHITLIPMLFQNGTYEKRLCRWEEYSYCDVQDVLIANVDDLRCLCKALLQAYDTYNYLIIRYHSSRDGKFSSFIKCICKEFLNIIFLHEKDDSIILNHIEGTIMCISLYMLAGKHMEQDYAWIKKLQENLCMQIDYELRSAICLPSIQNQILSKLD